MSIISGMIEQKKRLTNNAKTANVSDAAFDYNSP